MNKVENVKLYIKEKNVLAGISLKDEQCVEANNMAFHTAQNTINVIENRAQLARTIKQPLSSFVCAEQTHSANVYKVTASDRGRGALEEKTAIAHTDALYTREKNLVLCTFTADCVPVFFYHELANIVGVIHSGWSGTVKAITMKTLRHISDVENCRLRDFRIHIGTALSQKRFEVDLDVFILFEALGYASPFIKFNKKTNKYHIDNQEVVAKQCELIGIPREHIRIDKTCTYEDPLGFSYREDRQAGRHLGFIVQK